VRVAIIDFGSVWRQKLRKQDEYGPAAGPVYYNTTGVMVNGKPRQRPQICGYARFNAVGGFDPNHLTRMTHRVFECAEPAVWMGCNKLLFKRVVSSIDPPDCFLVVARSEITGEIPIGTECWRSANTWLVSLSEGRAQQEAMLLMPLRGWIQTGLGRFVLESSGPRPWLARLVLSRGE
jgi:hypothetical protein